MGFSPCYSQSYEKLDFFRLCGRRNVGAKLGIEKIRGRTEAAENVMSCIRARLQSCRKSMKIRWASAPATARVTKNSIFSHPAEARLIGLAVLLRTSQLVGSPTNSAGEETGCEAGLWRVD